MCPPRRGAAVKVAVELVPVVSAEGADELAHPLVRDLAKVRVEGVHPTSVPFARDVRVVQDVLQLDGHIALKSRELADHAQLA